MPVAQEADIGPDRREIVQSGSRHRVMIAAGADTSAEGMLVVGRNIDRIIGCRSQRDGGGALRFSDGAVCVAKNSRHDAIADRRLIVASAGACRIKKLTEAT